MTGSQKVALEAVSEALTAAQKAGDVEKVAALSKAFYWVVNATSLAPH